MNFLPENYKNPNEASQYTKLKDGENKIRILGSAVTGWEDWDDERKVYRFKMENKPAQSKSSKEGARIKHFWSFPIWNYQEEIVQICTLTQASIQKGITAIVKNPKWGDPKEYDIVICRTGKDLDTEYTVTPDPKEKIDPEIQKVYSKLTINLEALYDGGDPFTSQVAGTEAIDPDSIPEDL